MFYKNNFLFPIIIILVFVSAISVLYFGFRNTGYKENKINVVEVEEYQGEDLSSVNDFHENSIKGPQYINEADYLLKITGLLSSPIELTYSDVITNFNSQKKIVTLNCVEGWSVKILWEGVSVGDIIKEAGIMEGANTVIFKAYDGYSTSFPLDYILDNDIIMAYNMNEAKLLPQRGFPFQLVAESKWGYKWIKWITEIELSDDPDYRGYWESRGYSNSGDLDKSRYGE